MTDPDVPPVTPPVPPKSGKKSEAPESAPTPPQVVPPITPPGAAAPQSPNPQAPTPQPPAPYGAPYGGAPYGGAPYGGAPYGGAPYGGAPYGQQYAVPYPVPYGAPKPPTTLSLISMIAGIVGVAFTCCYGFGFIFAIAAVVLGHLGLKKEQAHGMAKAGLITGYAAAGLSILVWVLLGLVVMSPSLFNYGFY